MPREPRAPLLAQLGLSLVPSVLYGWWLWRDYPASLFAPTNALVVRDYVNLWAGGRLALAGRLDLVFDPQGYADWLREAFGARIDLHTFSYPPPMLMVALLFVLLPIVPGFLAWTLVTSGLLVAVLRVAGLPGLLVAAVLASPAVAENALAGQNGTLMAASLAGGLLMARAGRPAAAGLLLGLLVLKPQLGLLVPACLLAARDRRTILCTAGAAVLYAAISLLPFGVDAWRLYLDQTAPFMRRVMEAPFGLAFQYQMPSPFIAMRALGANLGLAYAVQGVVSLACVALVVLAWRPRRRGGGPFPASAVALALLAMPFATPHAHSYDLVAATVGVALLAPAAMRARGRGAGLWRLGLALAWLWPGIAFIVGVGLLPGLGPLVLAPALAYAARRAIVGATDEPSGAPGQPPAPRGQSDGAVEKSRTSTGFPPPAPQAGASTIPPRPQTG